MRFHAKFRPFAPLTRENFRKKVIIKALSARAWEGKLLRFVGVFAERKKELGLALATHTPVDADATYLKSSNDTEWTAELTRRYGGPLYFPGGVMLTACIRMDIMLQLFQEFATPQEKELAAMAKKMGGDAVLDNEQAMERLEAYALAGAQPSPKSRQAPQGRPFRFAELQQEIKSDPTEAIEKNAEFFNRKFDIQRRQIVADTARAVTREGDRIISAVTAGPHDRILDPVCHKAFNIYTAYSSPIILRISMTFGRRW